MVTLPYKELKAVAKIRGIEGYKRMPEEKLLKALEESEKPKPPEIIKEIRKENYDSDKKIRDMKQIILLKVFLLLFWKNIKKD